MVYNGLNATLCIIIILLDESIKNICMLTFTVYYILLKETRLLHMSNKTAVYYRLRKRQQRMLSTLKDNSINNEAQFGMLHLNPPDKEITYK